MSIDALSWAFKQELPCQPKFILVALADMADMDGKCWPSQGLLAKRCGIPRETVNRHLRVLEIAGMIRAEQRSNHRGKQSSLYFILCDVGSHPDVMPDHTPCDATSHRTLIEPSKIDSVAYATAVDPVKAMWERGKAVLGKSAGSLIGKARRDHGEEAVMAAILACEHEGPAEPVEFFLGCLRQKSRKRSAAEKFYAGAMEAADEFTRQQSRNGRADHPASHALLDSR